MACKSLKIARTSACGSPYLCIPTCGRKREVREGIELLFLDLHRRCRVPFLVRLTSLQRADHWSPEPACASASDVIAPCREHPAVRGRPWMFNGTRARRFQPSDELVTSASRGQSAQPASERRSVRRSRPSSCGPCSASRTNRAQSPHALAAKQADENLLLTAAERRQLWKLVVGQQVINAIMRPGPRSGSHSWRAAHSRTSCSRCRKCID